MKKLLLFVFITIFTVSCGDFINPYADLINKGSNGSSSGNDNQTEEDDGNTGADSGNTGGDSGNTGGDSGNTGGDSGNTGGDSGNTGGNTGNTGGDSGNTGGDSGNTGGDSGNTGGNTGSDSDTNNSLWKQLSSNNNFSEPNNGYDTILVYTPSAKVESYKASLTKKNATISSKRGGFSLKDYKEIYYDTNTTTPILPSEFDETALEFHNILREKEMELLLKNAQNPNKKAYSTERTKKLYICGAQSPNYQFKNTFTNVGTFSASCIAESDHAYLLSQDNLSFSTKDYLAQIDNIYKTVTEKFGPTGDVDGNGKILIIFFNANMLNLLGYFNPNDKILNGGDNDGDIIYLNSQRATDTNSTLETIAHELQHMTYFTNKWSKGYYSHTDSWLNEGLSMLSSLYCGYAGQGMTNHTWITNFLLNNGAQSNYDKLSLTNWTSFNYGFSALFTYYLNDVYGSDIAKKLYNVYQANDTGITAVEKATRKDFNQLFKEFAQALYLSGAGIHGGKEFNFTSIDLTTFGGFPYGARNGLNYQKKITPGISQTTSIYPYSLSFLRIDGAINQLNFSANTEITTYGVQR